MESVILNSVYDLTTDIPDKLVLVPSGNNIRGADGRFYINNNPQAIIDRWKMKGHDIPIDIEHSTERRGPQGLYAPAVGWVSNLEIAENGSLVGAVEWTEEGKELITTRKYRYYSPAYQIGARKEIAGVRSIGLTNIPNLSVPALNSEGDEEGEDMENNLKVICNSLGINEGADEAEVVTEINSLRTKLVEAEERASEAEKKIKNQEEAAFRTELNAMIEQGIQDGKIAPAQKDYFLTSINSQEGLEAFVSMLDKSPRLIASGETITGMPEMESKTELNSEERAYCDALGISVEEYIKVKEDK